MAQDPAPPQQLEPGSRVDVRSSLDGSWSHGFEVVEVVEEGYLVRRSSDERILPRPLLPDDVRRERRSSMWWI